MLRQIVILSALVIGCRDDNGPAANDLSGQDDLSSIDLFSSGDASMGDLTPALPDLTGVDGAPPPMITPGAVDRFLIGGTLMLPTGPMAGELLIEGNLITCVAASCSAMPNAAGATVIRTAGLVIPGLLDAHNHGLFDIFDESDWTPHCTGGACATNGMYKNHNQWTAETRYKQMVDAKQYLNGEGASPIDVGCQMDKYTEIKALAAATTSIVMAPGATQRPCYQSLARTIDMSENDLPSDKMQTSIAIPDNAGAISVCGNFTSGSTTAYVIHVAEGIEGSVRSEFTTLSGRPTTGGTPGCLLAPQTTIVHGTDLLAADFALMAAHSMKLVWSPKSNVFLYGDTAKIDVAIAQGVQTIALAPDWSLGGSVNLLDELAFAAAWDDNKMGNVLTNERLFRMVTIDAAKALGVDTLLGSLEVGKRADIALVAGDPTDAYGSLVRMRPAGVQLVFVDGRALYGDASLQAAGPPVPGCETLTVCNASKFICAAETSSANTLNETFAQISQILTQSLTDYDTMVAASGIAPFSPIAPLAKCP